MPLISNTTKDTLAALLAETAQKPKPLTVKQLVTRNKAFLTRMLKNGHSHDDIIAVLANEGISLAKDALTSLLKPSQKKRGRPKGRAKEKPQETSSEHQSDHTQVLEEVTLSQEQAARITAEWHRLSTLRKGLTKQELVAAMHTEINAALEAGYTFADIADLMQHQGIKIAATSLQKYHRNPPAATASPSISQQPLETAPTSATPSPASTSPTGPLPVTTASVMTTNSTFMEDFDDDE